VFVPLDMAHMDFGGFGLDDPASQGLDSARVGGESGVAVGAFCHRNQIGFTLFTPDGRPHRASILPISCSGSSSAGERRSVPTFPITRAEETDLARISAPLAGTPFQMPVAVTAQPAARIAALLLVLTTPVPAAVQALALAALRLPTMMAVVATCRLTPEPPPLWDREMHSGDTLGSRPAGVRRTHFPYEPTYLSHLQRSRRQPARSSGS
jgi:hypothetical protein